MTRLPSRRRFSAFIETISRNVSQILKSDKQYRSLSTGDLATSRPGYSTDFMEMNFGEAPTTSSLPAHFDDCDRVPVSFGKSGNVKLLAQTSAKAREIVKSGSIENLSYAKIEDIHRTQTWFFLDCDQRRAERILMSNGLVESSFLISYNRKQYVLSVWNGVKAQHYPIYQVHKKNGDLVFQLEIDKTFKNLVDLVNYYTKRKGYVLSSKLSKGVSRSLNHGRTPESHRSRA